MKVKEQIFEMLTENTGKHLLDSGDAYGRHWERNEKKTIQDFENEPEVNWDGDDYTISLFHYLVNGLDFDDRNICNEFNSMNVDDWESEIYGVSAEGEKWIKEIFEIERSFNSYNGESALSQVIQGTWLHEIGDEDCKFLLLQIHNGCDVRGGYTNAKLFYVPDYEEGVLIEDVIGIVTKQNGEIIEVNNMYNGYSLTTENGEDVEILENDKVELSLLCN